MYFDRMTVLRTVRRTAFVLAVLAMIAAAAPARAAGDEDFKGWFLALDAALTQPNGLEQQYAIQSTVTGTGTFADTRLLFDNDADFTGAIKIGYGFGNGMGKLLASYWGFDNEDDASGLVFGGMVPTVFGYDYDASSAGAYLYDIASGIDFNAKSKVQAATLDVDYLRSYAVGKKTTVSWLTGLRWATYEETQDLLATELTSSSYVQEHKHFKAEGVGLRLGAAVRFGFTEHFGLEGTGTFSFLQGNTDGSSLQNVDGNLATLDGKDDNVRGEMREYDLNACWSYTKMDYFVGYRMESWDGMVVDPVLATGFNSSLQGRDTVSFNSLHAGVIFKFASKSP